MSNEINLNNLKQQPSIQTKNELKEKELTNERMIELQSSNEYVDSSFETSYESQSSDSGDSSLCSGSSSSEEDFDDEWEDDDSNDNDLNCGEDRWLPEIKEPKRKPLASEKLFLKNSDLVDCKELFKHFNFEGKLLEKDIVWICKMAQKILKNEPNLLIINKQPLIIFGDLHGQFFDLASVLNSIGECKDNLKHFLFLGDYVDRGDFGFELVIFLFALKMSHPNACFLLRGNHECREMTARFNFKNEVISKYNENIYEEIMKTFDCLPLAAIVDDKFFCVHAGISPGLIDVEMINEINRFQEIPTSYQLFSDILWSDPDPNYDQTEETAYNFSLNKPRGGSYHYSYNAVINFLEQNDLSLIIRSHESHKNGHFQYKKWEETNFSSLITIFSCPNYVGMGNNKGAILIYSNKSIIIKEFHGVKHPYCLPGYIDGFQWSFPFLESKIKSVWGALINLKLEMVSNESSILEFGGKKNNVVNNNKVVNRKSVKNEKNPFQNIKKNRLVYYKVLSIIKIISMFSSLRKKKKLRCGLSPNEQKTKTNHHSDTYLNQKKLFDVRKKLKFQSKLAKKFRISSFESVPFKKKLIDGYTKFFLETHTKKQSKLQPKSLFMHQNKTIDLLNQKYKKKMEKLQELKKNSNVSSNKKKFNLIIKLQIKKLKKKK
ncbi:serine/threonine-protein phosphatase 2b catalytic subunit 1-related [Anaeramoeba flamelloides]|uniref:Serine/threonine-protein phosphatase n=1 Tax=Anaeramoeba flamelloides TaxID=1746091 RepID=A0AAV7YIT0_9EUKA|nr:serine/threonine-protein phosphatase 2b catalytic subunit 1-related [Anaeramoeba flamelloides]